MDASKSPQITFRLEPNDSRNPATLQYLRSQAFRASLIVVPSCWWPLSNTDEMRLPEVVVCSFDGDVILAASTLDCKRERALHFSESYSRKNNGFDSCCCCLWNEGGTAVLADKRILRLRRSLSLYPLLWLYWVHCDISLVVNFELALYRWCDGLAKAGRKLWTEPEISSSVKRVETLNTTNRGFGALMDSATKNCPFLDAVSRQRFLRWSEAISLLLFFKLVVMVVSVGIIAAFWNGSMCLCRLSPTWRMVDK